MATNEVQIVLVDDNDVDIEAMVRAFRTHKIANAVHIARDGVDALELLRRPVGDGGVPRPLLLLLDLNMPRMDGIELLQHLRADEGLRDTVVFVLTTSKRDEDKVASYQLNVAGYILKSEVGEGFMRLIGLLDRYWRVVEFPPAREG